MDHANSAAEETHEFPDHHPSNSQDDLSSSVDEKRQARQKRKRTSPDDQAVLEAAYKKDPKPDKAARLQLVEQVALTEKEVQIWFQNRRQSCRRRSGRPLLPHEIAQYHMARSTGLGHDDLDGSLVADANMPQFGDDLRTDRRYDQTATISVGQYDVPDTGAAQDSTTPPNSPPLAQLLASGPPLSRTTSTSSPILTRVPTHIGYLANQRSAPSLHRSFSENATTHPVTKETPAPKRPRAIRLSMDSEGNAIVTTKDTSSPSPPRPPQSILLPEPTSIPTPALSTAMSGTKRSTNGRSRDSRSWEFWCDKEARSELENVAEKDSHGSAAGAIGLLRSASGRSVLSPLNSKRNAPADSHGHSAKRSKLGHKRSSLQRSHTSAGRLQGKTGSTHMPSKLKHSGSAITVRRSGADSDKENWSPGVNLGSDPASDDSNEAYLVPMSAPRQSGIRQTLSPNKKPRTLRAGVDDPEADPELSSFMARGRESGGAASADADLDCIQGLLRLSQGSWKR
ncbi:unnamed protein product [Cercospora beticola]|nr:unnamed protein product [Cercospora beticola]